MLHFECSATFPTAPEEHTDFVMYLRVTRKKGKTPQAKLTKILSLHHAHSSNMDKKKITKKPPVAIPTPKNFLATELKMKFSMLIMFWFIK